MRVWLLVSTCLLVAVPVLVVTVCGSGGVVWEVAVVARRPPEGIVCLQ